VRHRKSIVACLAIAGLLVALFGPSAAQASFGIKSFTVTALNEDGSIDTQAGSHPYEYVVDFEMNQDAENKIEGRLANLVVDLPPGLVGNPQAVPTCKRADFIHTITPACAGEAQVGLAVLHLNQGAIEPRLPVYSLTPSPGVPASLGTTIFSNNSYQDASVRSGSDFGLRISDLTIPTAAAEIQSISEHIWGVPMSPGHFDERTCAFPVIPKDPAELEFIQFVEGCESIAKPFPFLSLPTSCGEPLETTIQVRSLQEPGNVQEATVLSVNEAEEPVGLSGCNQIEYEPSIKAQPTTNLADSPTGLDFNLHQPQNNDPEGLSTAHLKDTTVTLPQGLVINPSVANGLEACSESQVGYAPAGGQIHFTEQPQSCPDASKLGTVEVNVPLLDHKLEGAVYAAKPYDNPFGSLIALYLTIENKNDGIVAKLAGKVTPDPQTGQLTTTFKESPQLPLEDVDLHFFQGPRAALKTSLACGKYTTTSSLVPWTTPEGETEHPSDSFQTSVAAGGSGACPTSEAGAPNKPSFSAGTIAPQAGAYSPFVLKLVRQDGTQRLAKIDTILPKGLTGKLAEVTYCSEAAIAQAKAREAPNKGAVEQQSPSCPAASEVGSVTVGAGAGITPFYATGHAYLAGPYKGAQLSLAIITPAVAGPFDLGAVVVRTPLYVDPETTQIHAVSDPLPQIIEGVPLDVRSIALKLGRPNFTLNPTSCIPTSVLGSATSALGSSADLEDPFQVGGCNSLKFAPKLSLSLKGPTKRGHFPALKAVVSYPPGAGYANTASAQVTLPHSEFIEQAHFKTICTKVQFQANACPPGAIYGFAKAYTPLLDQPVQGPVYLRSSTHELPDLVIAFKGQVDAVLVGRVDTGKNGGIRNTFESAPDVPVSKVILEMQGGKKGLLVNSENICRKEQRAIVHLVGQNGVVADSKPLVKNDCKSKAGRKGKKGKR
jgi:hypothetical protein